MGEVGGGGLQKRKGEMGRLMKNVESKKARWRISLKSIIGGNSAQSLDSLRAPHTVPHRPRTCGGPLIHQTGGNGRGARLADSAAAAAATSETQRTHP